MTAPTSPTAPSAPFYVTGGTLTRDAPSYVVRKADTDLLDGLLAGQFCYVLDTRQMGKSSLMGRTATRLRQEGVAVAVLDLTAFGTNLSAEQWYDVMLNRVGRDLDLEEELDDYWLDHERLPPLPRFLQALREVVLKKVPGRVVLFVDEIDAVRSLPFSTDEFFAGIRECYNRRVEDPEMNRLTFCLLGVASPSDLIQDVRVTPFNIGTRIKLTDFTIQEAAPLAQGLGPNGTSLLQRVLYWTGGHPYLTQRLCLAVAEDPAARTPANVDRHTGELFFSSRAREQDNNLLFVRDRLLRSEVDLAGLLELYAQVRSGKRVADEESDPLVSVLRLSGIVRSEQGRLKVRNRIYEKVFDRAWVLSHMPDAELRRQRAAYRRGLLRAVAVSSIVLIGVGTLALIAVWQTFRANRAAETATEQAVRADRSNRRIQQAALLTDAQAKMLKLEADQRQLALKREQRSSQNLRRAMQEEQRQHQLATSAQRTAQERQWQIRTAEQIHRHTLLQMCITMGKQLTVNDPIGALPWFAKALSLENGSSVREEPYRAYFASLQGRYPGLLQIYNHRGGAKDVVFSPDGTRLLTVGADGVVREWDTRTGRSIGVPIVSKAYPQTLSQQPESVYTRRRAHSCQFGITHLPSTYAPPSDVKPINIFSAVYSPDGKRIVTAGADGTARVWDADTGEPVSREKSRREQTARGIDISGTSLVIKHDGAVFNAAYSPDGKRLVTASDDGTARIWDAYTGKPITPPFRHAASVRIALFSPDGRKILTGSADKTARLWDAATGRLLRTVKHDQGVNSAGFNKTGTRFVTASDDKTARVWDAETGRPVTPPLRHDDVVHSARFSPDGRRVVTASADKTAKIWDANTGKRLTPPLHHSSGLDYAEFSPDGRFIATADGQYGSVHIPTHAGVTEAVIGEARVWDAATGAPITPIFPHVGPVHRIAFSPDGRWVATASDDGAYLWDVNSRELPELGNALTKSQKGLLFAEYSADGRFVTAAGEDNTAVICDVIDRKRILTFRGHTADVYSAVFSPDGKRLLTASKDKTARIWEIGSGRLIRTIQLSGESMYATYSPDGTKIITCEGSRASVRDAATGHTLHTLMHDALVSFASFRLGGRRIVTACADGAARIWDVATGRLLGRLPRQEGPLMTAVYSRDGGRILTAGQNSMACIWNAANGKLLVRVKQDKPIYSAQFSPDGVFFVTAGADGAARVWSAEDGVPVTLLQAGQVLNGVAFSPDGKHILTASGDAGDGTLKVWDFARDDRPIQTLMAQALLLSHHQVDDTGDYVEADNKALNAAWDTLHVRFAPVRRH